MPGTKERNNDLTFAHKILFGDLSPWLDENKPDERFAPKLDEIHQVEPEFPAAYEVGFFRHFNYKTRYYQKFIRNESIAYCNNIFRITNEEDKIQWSKYWRNSTLDKKIPDKLHDIGKLIKSRQYELIYINPRKMSFDIDADHKSETYIIQLLKVYLIRIYLEIQNFFSDLKPDDLLIEDDLYTRFIFEPVPDVSFIKKIQPAIKIEPETPVEFSTNIETADQILYSFKYKQFDISPDKLADFCDSLKKYQFISKETTLPNFKKIFSGNLFSVPINWTGNPTEFSYLIKLLHNKFELVENMKQKQWKIACDCFIQPNNKKFDPNKVRKLQKPANSDILEKAVKLLS
jgi:hypothetical protein